MSLGAIRKFIMFYNLIDVSISDGIHSGPFADGPDTVIQPVDSC